VSWHVGPCSLGHMPTSESENEVIVLSLLHCKSCSLINIFCFLPFSYVLGAASNCWLALMDRLLTSGVPKSERQAIKEKMLDLVDIYYLALDAPKEGNKVTFNPGLIISVLDHPHVVFLCENHLYVWQKQSRWIIHELREEIEEQWVWIMLKYFYIFCEKVV
jgi:hypothetical protein